MEQDYTQRSCNSNLSALKNTLLYFTQLKNVKSLLYINFYKPILFNGNYIIIFPTYSRRSINMYALLKVFFTWWITVLSKRLQQMSYTVSLDHFAAIPINSQKTPGTHFDNTHYLLNRPYPFCNSHYCGLQTFNFSYL